MSASQNGRADKEMKDMHKTVLIPVSLDHESLVPRKLALARRLLEHGGRIVLLTVLENVPGFVTEFVTVKEKNSITARIQERLRAVADDDPAVSCEIVTGKPGVEIARYADDHGVDLIVLGSHSPGMQDYFLGSTASRVARRAPCSVLIVR